MKEVFQTFPIDTVVMWVSSYNGEFAYGVVKGYAFNSLDELCVKIQPIRRIEDRDEICFIHPQNQVTQLTAAVTGDRLWVEQ
jgi:hypothetical protein